MDIQKRLRQVLDAEAAAIRAIEVTDAFERAVDALFDCQGKVVVTGMGKAGLIAQKLGTVMCSTGTPAVFVHPGEAAHGDLGLIAEGDCIVAFSTSGKTREVLELIELSRHLGSGTIIGVTSHADSDLRRVSDIVVDMGEVREPCPLGLTPSASTAVMHAISDALALVLMERKGVTKHDYGLRHHGGYLGRRARTDNEDD
ncbi:MAG: SIS domain-containing protein [Alphaproteobacteria bacterium]|nr:SIS domain-containing protein [Alphaproteobacteria bacterium]